MGLRCLDKKTVNRKKGKLKMLNIDSVSIKDILKSITKLEFWYGALFIGGLALGSLTFVRNIEIDVVNDFMTTQLSNIS